MQPGMDISYINGHSKVVITILFHPLAFTALTHDLAPFSIFGSNSASISDIECAS